MYIQLKAVAQIYDECGGYCYEEATADSADCFGLYLGEPGDYSCIADFYDLDLAKTAGELLATHLGYDFIDAVLY